jgi:hypothetical protein
MFTSISPSLEFTKLMVESITPVKQFLLVGFRDPQMINLVTLVKDCNK